MVLLQTYLKVADNSGAHFAQCIKVLGPFHKKVAKVGDLIVVAIKHSNPHKKRVFKGAVRKALVIRSGHQYCRAPGIFVRFGDSSCVIINKKKVPIASRIKGPVLKETCLRHPSLASVSTFII